MHHEADHQTAVGFGALDLVVHRGVVGFRVLAAVGVVVSLVLSREHLWRPGVAIGVGGAALAFTAWAAYALALRPAHLARWEIVAMEVVIAGALLAADGWALGADRTWQAPSLGSAWPLAAPVAAGLALGWRWGALSGAVVSGARLLGALAPDVGAFTFTRFVEAKFDYHARLVPTVSTVFLYVTVGAGAGLVIGRLRAAETEVQANRAREELERSLHDGVLQTLLLLGHRVEDPVLGSLARDSARELRAFIRGDAKEMTDLHDALLASAAEFARAADLDPDIVVAPDLPSLSHESQQALAAATRELLANVARHAGARRVTLYAGPEASGVLVTVKDDGVGFDVSSVRSDGGLARSVRARIEAQGGRVETRSSPGAGTEVSIWVP